MGRTETEEILEKLMPAELVQFTASGDTQDAVVSILEEALRKAKSGQVLDVAIILAVRDKDGPGFWHSYYAEAAYSTLVAGTASLAFDLQYRRFKEADEQ